MPPIFGWQPNEQCFKSLSRLARDSNFPADLTAVISNTLLVITAGHPHHQATATATAPLPSAFRLTHPTSQLKLFPITSRDSLVLLRHSRPVQVHNNTILRLRLCQHLQDALKSSCSRTAVRQPPIVMLPTPLEATFHLATKLRNFVRRARIIIVRNGPNGETQRV